jgi:hypothetical protein
MQKDNPLVDAIILWADSVNESIINEQDLTGFRDIKEIEDMCKNLAVYNSIDDKKETKITELTAIENEEKCIWFRMGAIRQAVTHFQLLDAIFKYDHKLVCDVLSTLNAYIGNCYYFESNNIEKLLSLSLKLYAFGINMSFSDIYKSSKSADLKLRIRAARYLIKECSCEFDIQQGDIIFKNDTEKLVSFRINSFIADIGGQSFINYLYKNELSARFNEKMGRYIIARDKVTHYEEILPNARIPYNYLIQLSLKNLECYSCVLSEAGRRNKYNTVINIASAYLEVLNLQGHHAFEDMLSVFEDFPFLLSKNMLFEKLYVPRQYNYSFVLMLLDFLLRPKYDNLKIKPRIYTFDDYMAFAKYVLQNAKEAKEFDIDEIRTIIGVGKRRLAKIIEDVSMDYKKVNTSFIDYMDETNTWQKPLIRKKNGKLFCAGASIGGFGFYEVMYQILCGAYGQRALNNRLGFDLEELVYNLFAKKGIKFIKGKYDEIKDMPERDCDLIIEGSDKVCFIEIKKIPLPNTYEQGDDVAVLRVLGDGMLYAQEQIMWHKLRLKETGHILLYDKNTGKTYDFVLGDRRIYSISLCMPEYDFLTNPAIVHTFLESTMFVNYHANDSSREKTLDKLNRRIEDMRMLINLLYKNKKPSAKEVFFNASFMSLQQIWMVLQYYNDTESFLDYCQSSLCISCGRGDIYAELLALQRFRV